MRPRFRKRQVFAASLVVAVGAQLTFAASYATAATGSTAIPIKNVNSGLVLDVQYGSSADETPIIQWVDQGDANQRWYQRTGANGFFTFVSQASKKCMDVLDASTSNNAPLVLMTCNGGDSQQWKVTTSGSRSALTNKHSGLVVDIDGGSKEPGAIAQQWQDWGGTNQRFVIGAGTAVSTTSTTLKSTTASSTTAKTVVSSASSSPAADSTKWALKFSDDFNTNAATGTFLSTYKNWTGYNGGPDTWGVGVRDTNNIVSVNSGVLNMNLSKGSTGYRTAVLLPLINGGTPAEWNIGQTYGRYEVRFSVDQGSNGYAMAFLLWPYSNKWSDGEIDFPEGTLSGTINAYDHCVGNPSKNCFATGTNTKFTGWHTADIEWTPGSVKYILDGKTIGTSDESPNVPMQWVLQTDTSYGATPAATDKSNISIDYVKVWSYKG